MLARTEYIRERGNTSSAFVVAAYDYVTDFKDFNRELNHSEAYRNKSQR
jgi:hypothetical protein